MAAAVLFRFRIFCFQPVALLGKSLSILLPFVQQGTACFTVPGHAKSLSEERLGAI